MAQLGQRKCLCCGEFFDPDARNCKRQRYCRDPRCRGASKAASQANWLAKPQNSGYFRDPVHVARVQAWRAAHPGYGRGKPHKTPALQDPLIAQTIDTHGENPIRTEIPAAPNPTPLQDLLNAPSPVLAGLIAHLFDVTLQDDMAQATRRLVQIGLEVINRSRSENHQAGVAPRAVTPSTSAVQLG
jgi:hypothetical protein